MIEKTNATTDIISVLLISLSVSPSSLASLSRLSNNDRFSFMIVYFKINGNANIEHYRT
jgi:hypothetical protein